MYYVARIQLGLTEEEFWDSSSEKINALIQVKIDMTSEQLMKERKRRLELDSMMNEKGEVPIDCVDFL